ncbi:MAG: hypothetical protein MUF62_02125 [Chitinophagaceae bacterium]|nr:hypothetical protein [Chitinophagaceae bacterium]
MPNHACAGCHWLYLLKNGALADAITSPHVLRQPEPVGLPGMPAKQGLQATAYKKAMRMLVVING